MATYWTVMIEYTIKADSEEQVWDKWCKEEDVTYECIHSIDYAYDDEEEDDE